MLVGIQFLRFLAAGLVVLTHSLGEFPELVGVGAFGVDIFFVISGFIIYYITKSDVRLFLLKRLMRIVPMYWLFTLGIVFASLVVPSVLKSAVFDWNHILASLFFVPFWTESNGFNPILKLGWTLNFEMLFYGIFYFSAKISHAHRALISSFLILVIVYSLNYFEVRESSPLRFYNSLIWLEFIGGMFLAWVYGKWGLGSGFFPFIIFFSSLSILIYTDVNELDVFSRVLIWGIPAWLMVASTLSLEPYFGLLGDRFQRTIVWLGEMSYPLYLLHMYVIVIVSRFFDFDLGFLLLFLFSLSLSLAASSLVNRMYDVPLRRFISRLFD